MWVRLTCVVTSWGRRNPPDTVAGIIRNQQPAPTVDGQSNRPPPGFITLYQETGHDILGGSRRPAVRKRYINHFVPVQHAAIPTPVLANKGTAATCELNA
jgi:hypothetical protein